MLLLSALNPSRKPFNGQIRIADTVDMLNANVYLLAKIENKIKEMKFDIYGKKE